MRENKMLSPSLHWEPGPKMAAEMAWPLLFSGVHYYNSGPQTFLVHSALSVSVIAVIAPPRPKKYRTVIKW